MLDFARPIRFDLAPADLNALCARRGRGVQRRTASRSGAAVRPRSPRCRRSSPTASGCALVLVNLLTNARHAVAARETAAAGAPTRITLTTGAAAPARVAIEFATAASASAPRTCRASSIPTSRPGAPAPASAWPSPRNIIEGLGGTDQRRQPRRRRHRLPHRASATRRRAGARVMATDTRGTHPARRRRRRRSSSAGRGAARRRPRGGRDRRTRGRRSGCSAQRLFDLLVVDNLMPELTGLDLIRELAAHDARGRAAADPHDDRARHRRERDRGDEARRARLPAEAVRDRRAARRGAAARSSTSGCAPSTAT